MSAGNTVFRKIVDSISLDEAERILRRAEAGKYAKCVIEIPPVKPNGHEAFLYQRNGLKDDKYLCDQYSGTSIILHLSCSKCRGTKDSRQWLKKYITE